MQTTGDPDGPNTEVASDMAKPECGCMRAFKGLLKRQGGGPKRTSKAQEDSKISERSLPASSGKPPSAVTELPTSGLTFQDGTDPSQNDVTKNEGSPATDLGNPIFQDGTDPSQNDVTKNEGSPATDVGNPIFQDGTDPSQNDGTKNEGSPATDPGNPVFHQLPRGTMPPPTGVPSPIHN